MVSTTTTPTLHPRSSRTRNLLPREHGAYAQLTFPLLTAVLLSVSVSLSSLFWITASVCAFLAHEPALILLGHRGSRAQRELGERARVWSLRLALLLIATTLTALLLAPPPARMAMFVCIAGALPLSSMVWKKRGKSAPGELLAATLFAAAGAPILLGSGHSTQVALLITGIWVALFAMGTLSVRSVIRNRKSTRFCGWPPLLSVLLTSIAAAVLLHQGYLSALAAAALFPTAGLAIVLSVKPPHPRNLRALGFTLLGASSLATVLLVLAFAS